MFFAALMYLDAQGIVNINWDKLQSISEGVLSTIVNTVNSTAYGGVGGSPALPTTTMMTNLGIPLTSSTAIGFAIGIMKG